MSFNTFMSFMSDLRYALRRMRRSPGFTAVAIVVLALGIGVNTALFSIVNALFFKPLPVGAPEELVYVYSTNSNGQVMAVLFPEAFEFFRTQASELVEFTSHNAAGVAMSIDGETVTAQGELVRSSYFDLLGVKPLFGRVLGPQEDDPANPELAVVISHELWTGRFNADPAILGKRVDLDRRSYAIVGVMEPGFRGLSDFWTPSDFWANPHQVFPDGRFSEVPIGRLKPGVSVSQFRAFVDAKTPQLQQMRLDQMTAELRARYGDGIRRSKYPVFRASDLRMPFHPQAEVIPRSLLVALTIVVGLVLVIASANIAGLLLARGVTRTAEMAVRRALGAAGLRLTRQLLTETVLLSLIGGVMGLLVAWNVVALFRTYTPARFALDVPMDLRVLFFAVLLCIGAGVVVGVAPALQAARFGVLEALGTGIAGARGIRRRLRYGIVIPQVGLSLVLLTIAGIHVRSLAEIELKDLGYRTDQVVLNVYREEPPPVRTARQNWTAEDRRQYEEDRARRERLFRSSVLERVGALPNVAAHALTTSLPASADLPSLAPIMTLDGFLAGSPVTESVLRTEVSDGYVDVMGFHLRAGRTFDERDAIGSRNVAIVSEALAARLWTDRQPLGKQVGFVRIGAPQPDWLEVIGVVNEVHPILDETDETPQVYVPVRQQWRPESSYLVVRGKGDQTALVGELKKAVSGTDPHAEVWRAQTMRQIIAEILYPRRTAAAVLTAAGLIGLALACIGLYGVVAYSVAQRLREIGIRATLGAGRRDLVVLLLKDGAAMIVVGCLLGLILAVVAQRITAHLLPGLPAIDVISFLIVPPALGLVVLLACYLPARRAAAADPSQILRTL
jgi:putative ABC transport system permease protein